MKLVKSPTTRSISLPSPASISENDSAGYRSARRCSESSARRPSSGSEDSNSWVCWTTGGMMTATMPTVAAAVVSTANAKPIARGTRVRRMTTSV